MIRFFPRTLRLRITLLFALVFGVVSGGAAFFTYMHLQHDLYEEVDNDLRRMVLSINNIVSDYFYVPLLWDAMNRAIYKQTETDILPYFVQVIRRRDDSLIVNSHRSLRNFARLAEQTSQNPCSIEMENTQIRVYKYEEDKYTIFIASPIVNIVHVLSEIRIIYFIFMPFALLVAAALMYVIVSSALWPITVAARTAESISSRNLEERLPPPKYDDEVGELVLTLNRMIARLENAFTQITQFTADAAHELHTPLTILRGEIEVALRQKTVDEASVRLLQSNLDEVNRLITIVESLFMLARIDTRQLPVEFAPVELDVLLDELFEKAKVLAGQKQISIHLTRNDHAVIHGDTYRLIQLFLNLINNAIRYTPEGGTIDLASEKRDIHAHVFVRDTGIGIPKSEIPKIFNRFYRVDKARSREMGGSGLGLSIVKWVVDLHKGKIKVQSKEGKGSTFEVVLPLREKVG